LARISKAKSKQAWKKGGPIGRPFSSPTAVSGDVPNRDVTLRNDPPEGADGVLKGKGGIGAFVELMNNTVSIGRDHRAMPRPRATLPSRSSLEGG
jgi:hypothetical protein